MKKNAANKAIQILCWIKQVSVEGTKKWVVAVQSTQLIQSSLLRRANVETKVTIITTQQTSAEYLLTCGCRGMSVPEMETVVLLQVRRRVSAPALLHAALQHCTAMGLVLQRALSYLLMLCFSEHYSGCASSQFCAAHH